jgi:hypothetical protein
VEKGEEGGNMGAAKDLIAPWGLDCFNCKLYEKT